MEKIKITIDNNSLMRIENITLEQIERIWQTFIKGKHMFAWEYIRTDANKFANPFNPWASYTMTIQWRNLGKYEFETRKKEIENQL